MSQKLRGIPLGVKIFGMVASMLVLLVVVAYFSFQRLSRINDEIVYLSEYLIPITDLVEQVSVHALEQEVHLERVLKLYEVEPVAAEHIKQELELFEKRGTGVDEALEKAVNLSQDAFAKAVEEQNKKEFARLQPMLERIEKEHQDFHDHALRIVALIEEEKKAEAHLLEERLEEEENHFNREIEAIRLELERFTQKAASTAQEHEQGVLRLTLAITGIAVGGGILYAALVTVGLVRPIRRLMGTMRMVERGDLGVQVQTTSRDEIGSLAGSFNAMVGELRLKEKIKDTFGKYMDPRVVERLTDQAEGPETGGERKVMTVFFSDLDGFDAVAEKLEADALVRLTNQYLTLMSEPVSHHGGIIDKFIGTMVMAFWGPPFTGEEEHARMACYTALDQIAGLEEIHRLVAGFTDRNADLSRLDLRIGLSTGPLVVGNMGSEQTRSYTVMGDTVNTASRLKGATKQYGVRVMMTEDTQKMAVDVVETREIDLIQVVGKEEPLRVFELMGRKGEIDAVTVELREAFEEALRAYRDQDWDQALFHFEAGLKIRPDDGPASVYVQRVHELRENPPGDDWDGVWSLTKK